ncbi:MAG: cytochrome c3 family protein, partial [Calditrichota bacterium]
MKRFSVLCIVMAVVAFMATSALAFHDEGVARCSGCHTMHNSKDGLPVDAANPNGNPYLLIRATASEVCLSCHATERGAVWTADPLAPSSEKGGGNFCFINEDNLNDGRYGNQPANFIPGSYGVHNCIAPSYGGIADPALTTSPGGDYPAAYMSCTSCHDPHGNANFRLLYGAGRVTAGDFDFVNDAPECDGISYSSGVETPTSHTAYKGGMSAWCANCHGDYHQPNTNGKLFHPSGSLIPGEIATTYSLYNGTGQPDNTNPTHSYLPMVAFEDPSMTTSSDAPPSAFAEVSCISCHRAHGSSAPNIGRWDFNVGLYE